MAGFTAVGLFLVSLFFGFVIFILWLRIALRYLRISAINPLSRLSHSISDPIIQPINHLFQLKYQPGQKYDWIAFIVLVFIEIIKIISLCFLMYHVMIPFTYLLLFVAADLIIQPCDFLFYAILIRVIMSYVNPGWQNPIADFLRMLTQPLLILGRKIVPDISGFDFSPFIIMIILKIITLFITASLPLRLI